MNIFFVATAVSVGSWLSASLYNMDASMAVDQTIGAFMVAGFSALINSRRKI